MEYVVREAIDPGPVNVCIWLPPDVVTVPPVNLAAGDE
jgi:hypothetical protein